MASSRPLFVRRMLAPLGLVLLCLLIYVGLGWAVRLPQPWLVNAIGYERWKRLYLAYERAASSFLPADSDGDGASDGLELFLRTNPRDSKSNPSLMVENLNIDHKGRIWASPEAPPGRALFMERVILIYGNQRTPIHRQLLIHDEHLRFPRGFQARITPANGVRLALPGGALATPALLAPVDRDGTLRFDLQVPDDATGDPSGNQLITITNADGSVHINTVYIRRVWPLGSLAPSVQGTSREPLKLKYAPDGKYPEAHVSWRPLDTAGEAVLLEARQHEDSAEWQPLCLYWAPCSSAVVTFAPNALIPEVSAGNFRLTRVRLTPP